jgi:3-oxoacyl-[acyl-carrier protein] reductase
MAARVAVVSGGGSGIGRAIARMLVDDGARVVIIGRRSEVLAQAAGELNTAAGRRLVTWRRVDLTRADEVMGVAEAIADVGRVDVLVASAGGRIHGTLGADLREVAAFWQLSFEANVLSTLLLTQALLPHVRRPGGRIIAVESAAAFLGRGPYGPVKAALHAWARGLASALASVGVTVNVVAPRTVSDPGAPIYREDDVPLARAAHHSEVAALVGRLASREAGTVTGQILPVNCDIATHMADERAAGRPSWT